MDSAVGQLVVYFEATYVTGPLLSDSDGDGIVK